LAAVEINLQIKKSPMNPAKVARLAQAGDLALGFVVMGAYRKHGGSQKCDAFTQ
jgi:hypothetical protein